MNEDLKKKSELKVCHVTTVHPASDVRIFHKECVTLAEAGYDVTLLVAGKGDPIALQGVSVVYVPVSYRSRAGRMYRAPRALCRELLQRKPDVVHFHDPEFLICVPKLKRQGYRVIYDVHEDVPRQLMSKHWIQPFIRKPLAGLVEWFENRMAKKADVILTASTFIMHRFLKINKQTLDLRNFPKQSEFEQVQVKKMVPPHAVYIGAIATIRGAREMVLAMENSDMVLDLAGPLESSELLPLLHSLPGSANLVYHGVVGRDVATQMMASASVGLALLHPTINYLDALPTKLYEYMLAGIPVIASDFNVYKAIVEQYECGLCVSPLDISALKNALAFIRTNPDRAVRMGENGRRAALQNFVWEKEKEKLLQVYQTMVSEKMSSLADQHNI